MGVAVSVSEGMLHVTRNHSVGRMLKAMNGRGRVCAGVCPHAEVSSRHWGVPCGGMVHRVVNCSSIVCWKRLDLLLEVLGVEGVAMHGAPGISRDSSPRDAHPGVVGEGGVAVMLEVGLGRHVLHFHLFPG